jgi:AcrR family transcriptional regulator
MVRVRRDPQEARELILAAAARVFATKSPDVAGLKDVAREAGVSHALVTHYFGRYDLLVDEVVERVLAGIRARVAEALLANVAVPDPDAVMRAIFEGFRDPSAIRLLAWTFLRGQLSGPGSLPDRVRGLEAIANLLAPHVPASREEIEWVIVTGITSSFGFVIAGEAYLRALGHEPCAAHEPRFRAFLGDLLRERLFRVPGHCGPAGTVA